MTRIRILLLLALALASRQAWAPPVEKLVVRSLEIVDFTLELQGEVQAAKVAGTETPRKVEIVVRVERVDSSNRTHAVVHRYQLPEGALDQLGKRDTVSLPRLGVPGFGATGERTPFKLTVQLLAQTPEGKTEEQATTALVGAHARGALVTRPFPVIPSPGADFDSAELRVGERLSGVNQQLARLERQIQSQSAELLALRADLAAQKANPQAGGRQLTPDGANHADQAEQRIQQLQDAMRKTEAAIDNALQALTNALASMAGSSQGLDEMRAGLAAKIDQYNTSREGASKTQKQRDSGVQPARRLDGRPPTPNWRTGWIDTDGTVDEWSISTQSRTVTGSADNSGSVASGDPFNDANDSSTSDGNSGGTRSALPGAPPGSTPNLQAGRTTLDQQPLLLPTSSVDSTSIASGTVSSADIANNAVTTADLSSSTTSSSTSSSTSTDSSAVASNSVSSTEIANNTIASADLSSSTTSSSTSSSSTDSSAVASNSVSSTDIANNTITTAELSSSTTSSSTSSSSTASSAVASGSVASAEIVNNTIGTTTGSGGSASGNTAQLTAGVPLPPIAHEVYVAPSLREDAIAALSPPAAPPPAAPVPLDQTNPSAFAISFAHSGMLSGQPAFGPPAAATQSAGAQLETFVTTGGSPGSQVNIGRGTAQSPAAETGGDSLITWARWTSGTTTGSAGVGPLTLSGNQGFHYVVGAATPPVNLPASGTATFTLMGATKPTFGDGALAPGTFTGSMAVQWGGAAATKVGVDFNITMPGDASYRLMSAGGVATPSSSLISTSLGTGSAFTGPANVTVTGTGRACPGACSGNVNGFFAGSNAERAGAVYMIGFGGTGIHGAAAFTR